MIIIKYIPIQIKHILKVGVRHYCWQVWCMRLCCYHWCSKIAAGLSWSSWDFHLHRSCRWSFRFGTIIRSWSAGILRRGREGGARCRRYWLLCKFRANFWNSKLRIGRFPLSADRRCTLRLRFDRGIWCQSLPKLRKHRLNHVPLCKFQNFCIFCVGFKFGLRLSWRQWGTINWNSWRLRSWGIYRRILLRFWVNWWRCWCCLRPWSWRSRYSVRRSTRWNREPRWSGSKRPWEGPPCIPDRVCSSMLGWRLRIRMRWLTCRPFIGRLPGSRQPVWREWGRGWWGGKIRVSF